MTSLVIDLAGLQTLLDVLQRQGYTVIGPTIRDGAIVNAEIGTIDDLPRGWGDEQEAGRYRLRRRTDDAVFGFAAAAQSAKPVFFPASALLCKVRRTAKDFSVETEVPAGTAQSGPPYALFGVRSCDLHAIAMHDRILRDRLNVDDDYVGRRRGAFVVAVTCGHPGGTCFCASMGTGPQPADGYDLLLTELIDEARHDFLAEPGNARGAQILAEVPGEPADAQVLARARRVVEQATSRMGRTLQTEGLREALYAAADSPVWQDVASRCLSCANCTLVCPTCFCSSLSDVTDLASDNAERRRIWASCFAADFSYLHGGAVRKSAASRYRQWLTHKFASWIDQFGAPGCVGCGRCITWCPAAIDLSKEAAAVRAEQPDPEPDVRRSR